MSVRRLDPVQPASFTFTAENTAWAKKTIAQYPVGKQASAIIALLWRAQEQNAGWLSKPAMEYVGQMLDMALIRVYEVATFYTMFQLSPVGKKAHVQVCGTTPCMLRGAEDLKKVCQSKIHHDAHHLSADGNFSWEEVECLGACVNAPMVQIWKDTYEDLTPASFEKLLDDLAAGKSITPGPQNGRQLSAPMGALTSLTDKSLYANGRTFTRVEAPPPPAVPAPAATVPPVVVAPPAAPAPAPVAPAPAPVAVAPVAAPIAAKPVVTLIPEPAKKVEDAPKPVAVKAAPAKVKNADGSPELLKKPRSGKGDDLKLIWGIGPALEKMLQKMGVWHFDQIAAWSAAELKWVDTRLEGFKGRAKRDEWIKQSKKLAKGWRPDNAVGDKPKGRG
jgi:NADH-quinone oxidoreductase subunit E